MLITASWEGADVPVELDETCVTLDALKKLLQAALPGMDVEKVCLKVGGRAVDEDAAVLALVEGCVLEASLLPALQAKGTLLREGYTLDGKTVARAVAAGDVRLFQLCLDADVPLNPSTLSVACHAKHVELCKFLIDCGFDVNGGPKSETLHFKDTESISWDARDFCANLYGLGLYETSMPPLQIAASKGSLELCNVLIDRGADLEDDSSEGNTPLQVAIHGCTRAALPLDVCKLLIDRGCDTRRSAGRRPLATAIDCCNLEACKLLLDSGCGFGGEREKRESHFLFLALSQDDEAFEMCNLLINHGCDVNVKNADGDTPLLRVVKGHFNKFAFVLPRGEELRCLEDAHIDNITDTDDEDSETAKMGQLEVCRTLIACGGDLNIRDQNGRTALHAAVALSDLDLCTLLVDHGCNLNIKCDNGDTPLHQALRLDDDELWKLLVDRGCNVDIKDSEGNTPLHYALLWGNLEMFEHLIDRVTDVEAKDRDGVSPLHRAFSWGKRQVCAHLIERGCDVDTRNKQGSTPLHRAITLNNAELCRLLIDRGCDVQATNKKGQTPLEASEDKPKVQQVLLECCAGDPRAKRPRLE